MPGGCAMISMPLSSGSFSSSSVSPARPPPNSVLKVSWKLRLIAANASREALARRLVDALDGFARLRDRVDEILALRRQERVARLELVELLDRHHVDRAEPIDLRAQRRDRLLGAERRAAPRRRSTASDRRGSALVAACDRRRRRSRRVSSGADDARVRDRVALRVRAASTSTHDLVERRLHRVDAGRARGATRSLSAVARATSSSATTARTASSAPRASLIDASCSSVLIAQRRHRVVGRADVLTQRVERRARRRRAALRRRRSPPAARRRGAACPRARPRARRPARSSSAAASSSRRTSAASAAARSTSAACAAPASAARRLRSSAASRASNRRRCADGQPLVGRPLLLASRRAIDARASSWRRSSASRSSSA